MARLPRPGGDNGDWGNILNDYLSQAHNPDGSLKDGSVTPESLAPNTFNKAALGLSNVDNTADLAKPVSTAQQSALNAKADASALASKLDSAALDTQTAGNITTTNTATRAALNTVYAPSLLQGHAIRRSRGNGFAALGDSIVGGYPETFTTPGAADVQLAPGWFTQACIQSNQRMRYVINAGISGNTSAQALARIQTDVIAYAPDYCIVAVGENDEGNALTAAQTIANLTAIYDALKAAGIEPVCATVMGKSTGSPSINTLLSVNEFIRAYAQKNGHHLLDFASFMLDASNASGQILPVQTMDGTHPNAAGYKAMADYVVAQLVPLLPLASAPLAVVNSGGTKNLIGNACMLTDANADGVPDNWAQGTAGTSTITPSLQNAPTGSIGKFFRIQATAAGSAREYKYTVNSNFTPGDVLDLTCRIRTNLAAGGSSAMVAITFTGSSNKARLYNWKIDVDGVLYLPFTVPAGATQIILSVYINSISAAQGTGYIDIGQVNLRNKTVLAIA